MKTDTLSKLVESSMQSYRAAVKQAKAEKANCVQAEEDLIDAEEAQLLLQEIAQATQMQAHSKIAGVVSRCLEAVFDEPYEFVIEFVRNRGRTEAKLLFKRGDLQMDPLSASGGGVVDVAAFALRVACLVLSRPRRRRVVVMDEPFKFVSEQYRERVREMILALSEEMSIQFIMVTHIRELECGTVIRL